MKVNVHVPRINTGGAPRWLTSAWWGAVTMQIFFAWANEPKQQQKPKSQILLLSIGGEKVSHAKKKNLGSGINPVF